MTEQSDLDHLRAPLRSRSRRGTTATTRSARSWSARTGPWCSRWRTPWSPSATSPVTPRPTWSGGPGGTSTGPSSASYTLFTSCEPCAMCAGAIYWSGIGRMVFALSETGPPRASPATARTTRRCRLPSRQVLGDGQPAHRRHRPAHRGRGRGRPPRLSVTDRLASGRRCARRRCLRRRRARSR